MSYKAAWWLKNGHVQSIYPSLFRSLDERLFTRERIETPDDDFLDLDWAKNGHERVVVISHGLEGHSRRPYVLGMAQAAMQNGWDVLAWNFRSCAGDPNRKLASYHSGATDDLSAVINHAVAAGYREVALVGFSIGGNKTIRYLANHKQELPAQVLAAVVFSVPYDLTSTSWHLAKPKSRLYMKNFLVSFKEKLEQKAALFPGQLDLTDFNKIKTFKEYDERFTAPLNGFDSAEDYWIKSSSRPCLPAVDTPTLMISSKDDPFLTPECFPYEEVEANPALTFDVTDHGGHIGFMDNIDGLYWSEWRAISFLNEKSALSS